METVAGVVRKMRDILMGLGTEGFVKADPKDPHLGYYGAYVRGLLPPIYLGPSFFALPAEEQTRTLIHESAHLAGIDAGGEGELYYLRLDCSGNPPTVEYGTPLSRRREDQADAWGKYVHCVSFQPPDTDDRDTVRSGRTHVVQSGDYLSKIAKQYYGDAGAWRKIYDANRATIGPNPDKLFPGQKLTIP
jgi:nucleoid-associated protein YgaU